MFARLVQKELLHYLLDARFIVVFALCTLLSALSVYMGGRNYVRQLQEYSTTAEGHRRATMTNLEKGEFPAFWVNGDHWNRKPEALSPVVYGLSGKLGQEVQIQYQRLPKFEASLFDEDPIYAHFGILDLAFIVEVVLSLCVLLFTYDTICGEKEGGTLRLYASSPVSRSNIALAKLVGSSVAVLAPLLLSCLLSAAVLALFPEIDIKGEDWLRLGALMVVFALYLVVFAAFGLLASAITHRRMIAFLGLLGLWTIWVFIVPDVAVRVARRLKPIEGPVELQKRVDSLFWEVERQRNQEVDEYWKNNPVKDFDALPEARKRELWEGRKKIYNKWDAAYYSRLTGIREEHRNQMRQQQRLAMALSVVSPFGAVTFASMDLARTGFVQQERIENALDLHLAYLAEFLREKQALPAEKRNLTDYIRFTYQDGERWGACLTRNMIHILNLALLGVLGFAGAYVFILRYDVR